MYAIVEIPQSIKDQIIEDYLDECAAKVDRLIHEILNKPVPTSQPKVRNQKKRAKLPDSGTSEEKGKGKPRYYKDNIQIGSLTDIPKGINPVNGFYQVYYHNGVSRQSYGCFDNLTDAVVRAYEIYSNLPGIKPKNYRSITDYLELAGI